MERRSRTTHNAVGSDADVISLNRRGHKLTDAGHYMEAIANFDRAIQIQPDNYAAWYGRGNALTHLKRFTEALLSFERAVALSPKNHEAWTFQGVVLVYLERYQEALDCCERAIALQPAAAEAWTFCGVALQRLGRYKQAYASFDIATQEQQRRSWWQMLKQFLRRLLSQFQPRRR